MPAKPSRLASNAPLTLHTTSGYSVNASAMRKLHFDFGVRMIRAHPAADDAKNSTKQASCRTSFMKSRATKNNDATRPYHYRGFSSKPSTAAPTTATESRTKKLGSA